MSVDLSDRCVLASQVCAMRPNWEDQNGMEGEWGENGWGITGDWLSEEDSSDWFGQSDYPPDICFALPWLNFLLVFIGKSILSPEEDRSSPYREPYVPRRWGIWGDLGHREHRVSLVRGLHVGDELGGFPRQRRRVVRRRVRCPPWLLFRWEGYRFPPTGARIVSLRVEFLRLGICRLMVDFVRLVSISDFVDGKRSVCRPNSPIGDIPNTSQPGADR